MAQKTTAKDCQQIGPSFAKINRAAVMSHLSLESTTGRRNARRKPIHGYAFVMVLDQACRSATNFAPSIRMAADDPNGAISAPVLTPVTTA